MALELIPPPKGCSAVIFPKAMLGSQDMVPPSNHIPLQAAFDRGKPRLAPKVCPGQDYKSNRH